MPNLFYYLLFLAHFLILSFPPLPYYLLNLLRFHHLLILPQLLTLNCSFYLLAHSFLKNYFANLLAFIHYFAYSTGPFFNSKDYSFIEAAFHLGQQGRLSILRELIFHLENMRVNLVDQNIMLFTIIFFDYLLSNHLDLNFNF